VTRTKLPPLPKSIQRKLDLQWTELTCSHGFPEEGLKLPDTRGSNGQIRAANRQPAHEIAISERLVATTVRVAGMRFEQIAREYIAEWSIGEDPRTEVFAEWLAEIKAVVTSELAGLWAKSEWHPSFQRRCLERAGEELTSSMNAWKSRATRLEIQKLENPHLSLESLVAAAGDTTVALTLDQGKKAINEVQQLLNILDVPNPVVRTEEGPARISIEDSSATKDQSTRIVLSSEVNRGSYESGGATPCAQVISPQYAPSRRSSGLALSETGVFPASIPSQQRMGSPIIHMDLAVPLLRHELIVGASGPPRAQADALCKEIVRLANRIQAVENPELPAAEAADRWFDRLSITPRRVWEFEETLAASAEFCTDFAIHLLRAGKRELSADFDTFAARFKALLAEYFPAPISPPVADKLTVASPSLVGTVPEGRIGSETSSPLNLSADPGTTKPAAHARAWKEVEIRFLSDNRVQVTAAGQSEPLTYAEFGFEDGRSKTPILAWVTLRSLAEAGGTIQRPQNGPPGASFEKQIEKIRSTLRKRFQLETDPIPFIRNVGYQAQFKISCGPSYNS
jgi:hypothetical protein